MKLNEAEVENYKRQNALVEARNGEVCRALLPVLREGIELTAPRTVAGGAGRPSPLAARDGSPCERGCREGHQNFPEQCGRCTE